MVLFLLGPSGLEKFGEILTKNFGLAKAVTTVIPVAQLSLVLIGKA